MSSRHKTNDHLWFAFFHEAAHQLLHRAKNRSSIHVDEAVFQGEGEQELQADGGQLIS